MKRFIILVVLIFYASTAGAWDKHGPAWKIEDGVVSPGVSATSVDFTGYSTSGLSIPETDPIAMPVLANVSSQLNSLETSFTNFTGNVDAKTLNGLPDTSFTLLSTFSAYTSTAGNGATGAFVSYTTVAGVTFANVTGGLVAEDITAVDIMLVGTFGVNTTIDVEGSGTRCFFLPGRSIWRCGTAVGDIWDNENMGPYSSSEGHNNEIQGSYGHGEGQSNFIAAGVSYGHVEGYSNDITAGNGNHAEGNNNTVSSTGGHVEGSNNIVSGTDSHAEGKRTSALGSNGSHAEGYETIASGSYGSHAEGDDTVASGRSSHAGGTQSISDGLRSFVHGYNIKIGAGGEDSIMFGSYATPTEREANPLEDPDTMFLANMDLVVDGDLTVAGESTVKSHAAYLAYEDVTGFFEDYSTADIYYKWQNNINDSASFGNMSASAIDGSITILPSGDGVYQISRNTGIHGQPEVGYSFAIFKNETALSESHTSPGVPDESRPFFMNLSSYGEDAAFGVNSTIDFLFYPDKDQIDIIEGATGNGADQWCFELDMHFKVDHLPDFFSLGNTQYTGGAGHFADAMTFDNWSSEWDDLRAATGDIVNAGSQADYKNENIAFAFPNDGNQARYVLDGIVKVKLRHNSSVVCSSGHTLWVDQASVTDLLGARSDSTYIIMPLVAGDKITIREKPNVANKFFHRHKTILNISRIGDLDT